MSDAAPFEECVKFDIMSICGDLFDEHLANMQK